MTGSETTGGRTMYSLNPDGVTVTHDDAFGDGTPLCGFSHDEETATADAETVTCLDCIAAF